MATGLKAVTFEPSGLTFHVGATLQFTGYESPALAVNFVPGASDVDLTYASRDVGGVASPGAPCVTPAVLITGPEALGEARTFNISVQATATSPVGTVSIPAAFTVNATGASTDLPMGGLVSVDGTPATLTLDRGDPADGNPHAPR